MNKPRVLLMQAERHSLICLQEDFYVILIARGEASKQRSGELADEIHVLDYTDLELLESTVAQIHAEGPLSAIFALGDDSALPAATMAKKFGIPGIPHEAIAKTKGKARLRELLNSKGISTVRFRVIEEPIFDCTELESNVGFPLICKPADGFGSQLVRQCGTAGQLSEYLSRYPFDSPLLVEEFIFGPEFSVECFTRDKNHRVIAFTEKFTTGPPNFVELGHIVPAPISEGLKKEITEVVTAMLDALGLELGPSHTEFKLTPEGPKIIESHVRPGGDGIEELVWEAYDFSLTLETLKALIGRPMKAPRKRPQVHASAQFFEFPSGTIKSLKGVEDAAEKKGVKVFYFPFKDGDQLSPVDSSLSRHGYFGCVAPNRVALEKIVHEVRSDVQVVVE